MKIKIFISFSVFVLICSYVNADDIFDEEELGNSMYCETISLSAKEPITTSKHIIVLHRNTHLPLYEKNAYDKTAMASTTKIMTCILAIENCNLEEKTIVSKNAVSVYGSIFGLSKNMEVTIGDLLYGLMLRSGNDCAIALAEHISGSVENFAILMNKKAQELNLLNTHFVTPHGLDNDEHYTSAYDLALLTDYALNNSTFKKIVQTKNIYILGKSITNTNELLENCNGVYGVKTGFTFNAGRCLVSSCVRNNLDIIVVVLGANTKKERTQDSINLINYIYQNYNYVDISSIIKNSFDSYLPYFINNYSLEKTSTYPILNIEIPEHLYFPLTNNDLSTLKSKIYINSKYSSNIKKNSTVGYLSIYTNSNELVKLDIKLDNELNKNDIFFYIKKILFITKNFMF